MVTCVAPVPHWSRALAELYLVMVVEGRELQQRSYVGATGVNECQHNVSDGHHDH